MSSENEEAPVGGRWKEYTQESWTRTSIVGGTGGTGFVQDERMNDPSVDWMNSKESRQEFFNNLEQQYTYFCYGEKDYEACQKRADFLITFRQRYQDGKDEYKSCCNKYGSPGCCFNLSKMIIHDEGLKKNDLKDLDVAEYWSLFEKSCFAGEYPRSKQQHDFKSEACLSISDAINQKVRRTIPTGATGRLLREFPGRYLEKSFTTKLVQNIKENCERACSHQFQSCNFLGAAMLNKRVGEAFGIPFNPKEGIRLMDRACTGSGPGLGQKVSCDNLAKIYKRGAEALGIRKDIGKTLDYERKAFLMTSPGMEEVAMKNMPKAGQLIS